MTSRSRLEDELRAALVAIEAYEDLIEARDAHIAERDAIIYRLRTVEHLHISEIADLAGMSDPVVRMIVRDWTKRSYGSGLADVVYEEAQDELEVDGER